MSLLKAKSLYTNDLGINVPGATTITKEWGENSFPLMYWAWDCGMHQIDFRKKSGKAADAGTLGHMMIQNGLLGLEVPKEELDQFTQEQIELAETAHLQWMEFESQHKIELLTYEGKPAIEVKLTSKEFGGTLDMIMRVDGDIALVDLKTGSGIYPDHIVQVAGGYSMLATEYKIDWKKIILANVPKDIDKKLNIKILDRDEDTEIITASQLIFDSLLNVYNNKKYIKDFLKR